MKRNVFLTKLISTFAVAVTAAGIAGAATVQEGDYGQFAQNWRNPTELGAGIDGISGTGRWNQPDILHFTGLTPGAQTLTFTFSAPEGIGYSYSAGGEIRYSFDAFRYAWDGMNGGAFHTGYSTPRTELTINLGDSFGGELYLGLYFTYGRDLAYSMSSSLTGASAPEPSPVPVPAAGLLLGTALAAGAAFAARRRRG